MLASHEPFHLDKWSAVKVHGHIYNYILLIIFFNEAFKYGNSAKFWGYIGTDIEQLCRVV
jgi:hypothetical protein